MGYDVERLHDIFMKTGGRCHLSGETLVFSMYGKTGRGSWEVEHSIPRALGGTDHLNNLFPAAPGPNRAKGARSTRSVRAEYGLDRSPVGPAEAARVAARERAAAVSAVAFGGAALGVMWGLSSAQNKPDEALPRALVGGLVGFGAAAILADLFL